MRRFVVLLLLAGCVQSPSPDQYETAILAALRDNDCRYVGGQGDDDARFALVLSPYLGIPAEDLADLEGPYYDQVDQAIQRIVDRGDVSINNDSRIVTLLNCP